MANPWEDPEALEAQGPAGLRNAVEKANERIKALERQLQTEAEAKAQLATQVRTSTVSTELAKLGIDGARFASFVPADVEASEAALKKWVDDNKSVYAFGQVTQPEPQQQQAQ